MQSQLDSPLRQPRFGPSLVPAEHPRVFARAPGDIRIVQAVEKPPMTDIKTNNRR